MRSKASPDTGLPTIADTNQTRLTSLFVKGSDFDHIEDEPESQEEPYEEGLHGMKGMNPFISEEMASNPAVSDKQQRFMAMCAHDPEKAQGKCPSKDVAQEFSHKP
jgi:hypothetical protein